jgi:hypothetical protein
MNGILQKKKCFLYSKNTEKNKNRGPNTCYKDGGTPEESQDHFALQENRGVIQQVEERSCAMID